jgi:hypothetical protein
VPPPPLCDTPVVPDEPVLPLLPLDCVGVELCVGAELWVEPELVTGVEDTDELPTDELPVEPVAVLLAVVFGLVFGFAGGACSAGTAPALLNGVMLACCPLAELDGASDPVGVAVDVVLTADPMAKAATNPTTSAATSINQRLRTSWPPGAALSVATSLPDINELSI